MARPTMYDSDHLSDLLILRRRGLTIREAAEQLGMSKTTAYRLLARKDPRR